MCTIMLSYTLASKHRNLVLRTSAKDSAFKDKEAKDSSDLVTVNSDRIETLQSIKSLLETS